MTPRRMLEHPPRRERGVALLVAILLVALATVIAASLAYHNAMTARRTIGAFDYDQALLVTEGTEAFAPTDCSKPSAASRARSTHSSPGRSRSARSASPRA